MAKVVVDNLSGNLSFEEVLNNNLCHFQDAMVELGLGDPENFNVDYLQQLVESGALLCPILYDGKNIGGLMISSDRDLWDRNKGVINIAAYIKPEYRGKNVLLKALNYIKRRMYKLEQYHFVFRFNVHHTKQPLGRVVDYVCELDF